MPDEVGVAAAAVLAVPPDVPAAVIEAEAMDPVIDPAMGDAAALAMPLTTPPWTAEGEEPSPALLAFCWKLLMPSFALSALG